MKLNNLHPGLVNYFPLQFTTLHQRITTQNELVINGNLRKVRREMVYKFRRAGTNDAEIKLGLVK